MKKLLRGFAPSSDIDRYFKSGRIPWSPGYKQYRLNLLKALPTNIELLRTFSHGGLLPSGYGVGVDERIVEYPWALSRIPETAELMLDGGSVLNYPFLLDSPQLSGKRLVILTLAPESAMEKRKNVSYMFGDLRETIFRDNVFDVIISISTLEHVGMDNAKLYTHDSADIESRPEQYLRAIREFHRILKPGGRFLMTVPFGKPQNLGWLHQFDDQKLRRAIDAFGPKLESATFYKYQAEGWMISDAAGCADSEYFDVHSSPEPAPDLAAAARAVACLEFVKHAGPLV